MAPQNPRDMRDYMRTLERLASQARAMPGMISAAIETVEEVRQEEKARHPAPPIELDAQTAYYYDVSAGRHRVRLNFDFPDVIFNTDGTTALIQQYELWGYEELPPAGEDEPEQEKPWTLQSVNTDSYFRVEGYIPGSRWTFRARALGTDATQPGEWSETITATMNRDGAPPPQPTAPEVTAMMGQLTVKWDGKAVSGEMPADTDYVIVAHGTASSPTVEVARLDRMIRFYIHTGAEYNTPQFFRLRAVDESGNLGPWSEQAVGVTTPLVDIDPILSEIDAGKVKITNASQILLEASLTLGQKLVSNDTALANTNKALTGPGGVTERLGSAESKLADVGSLTYATGQTLRQKLAEADTALANTNKALTGTGGVTERLAGAELRLTQSRTANAITDPMFVDPDYVRRVDLYSTCRVALNADKDMTVTASTATTYFRPLGQPQTPAGFKNWIPVKPGQRWRFELELENVTVAGGWVWFTGRTADGTAYANPANSTRTNITVGGGKFVTEMEVPAGCFWIMPEMLVPANAGVLVVKKGSMVARQAVTQEMLVDGAVLARHVTASEEMSAKLGQFLKLDVGSLVAGTANLETAVANKFFANIFATNKLTASQVLIGEGGNLMGDPNFLDPEGWGSNGAFITANAGRNGNNALVIPARAAQVGGYYGSGDRNRQFAVVPGASYKISVWAKPAGPVPVNGVAIYMKWSTPNGASSGTGFSTPGNIANKEPLVAGQWTQITGIVKLPDDAVKGFIGPFTQASANVEVAFSEPSAVQAVDQGLIVDNGILARHIEASESMSAKLGSFLKLDVGALTATGTSKFNEVVSNRMFTDIFAANKITASELLVGAGPNLIPNGAGEWGKAGAWSASLTWDPADAPAGLPGSFKSAAGQGTLAINDGWFDVEPETDYLFEVWLKTDKPDNRIYFEVRDNEGVLVPGWKALPGEASGAQGNYPITAYTIPQGKWTKLRAVAKTRSVTHKLRVGAIYFNHSTSGNRDATVGVAGMRMIRRSDSAVIVDGGILTRHLTVTEDMTVALLKAHKVLAGEIDTNSLSADTGFIGSMRTRILTTDVVDTVQLKANSVKADQVAADAITAKHSITGALHRTAVTGARTEMTKDGIRVLNGAGVEQVKLGYGLETGLAVLNPYTNRMTSLQNHVFGTQYLRGSFKSNDNDNGGVAYGGNAHRGLKSTDFATDLTFTAVSDTAMILLSLQLSAWLSAGLTTAVETGQGTARVEIYGVNGEPNPPYQIAIWSYSFALPYGMNDWYTNTIIHQIPMLVPGRRYRITVHFGNGDNKTANSRVYWDDASAVVIPI